MSRYQTLVTKMNQAYQARDRTIDKGATYPYFNNLANTMTGVLFLHMLGDGTLFRDGVFRYGFVVQTIRNWPCLDSTDSPQN